MHYSVQTKHTNYGDLMNATDTTDPFMLFDRWMTEAEASEPNLANAMCLSTTAQGGAPSSRMVLLKEYGPRGVVFYTNMDSRKGRALRDNDQAALCLHWKSIERQVTIEGRAVEVTGEEADAYFATRPRGAQIGAWASKQSQPLKGKRELEARVKEFEVKYGDVPVPRPPNWSGFRLVPTRFEFWQGRDNRLHDRRVFTAKDGGWTTEWLYP